MCFHYVEGRTDHKNKETVGLPTNKQASSLQITRSRTDTDPSDLSNCLGCGLMKREMCVMFSAWRDERDNVEFFLEDLLDLRC